MKKVMLGLFISLLIVFQVSAAFNKEVMEYVPIAGAEEGGIFSDSLPIFDEEPPEEEVIEKASLDECVKQWKPYFAREDTLVKMEAGKIHVTFDPTVSFKSALLSIERHGLQIDTVINIFGVLLKQEFTDEESFNQYHMVILKGFDGEDLSEDWWNQFLAWFGLGKKNLIGQEVEVACEVLQDPKVLQTFPVANLDFAGAIAAQLEA